MIHKRHGPRRQLDALTNRGVTVLLLFLFGFAWIIWTSYVVDYDLAPEVLHHRPSSHQLPDQLPGYYETWDWTNSNFSDLIEYQSFIGRLGTNASKRIPFELHQFSADTSDRLEVDRLVPDTRYLFCSIRLRKFYGRLQEFGRTSVIITFYNEAASVLLRTIVSVLRNTPAKLLDEIILIDDASSHRLNSTFLKAFHRKIRFKRNARREGVIASRTIGATLMASGEYIVFLDSHCEVNVGWLEPLVERMVLNPGTVVSPVIDVIEASSFAYKYGGGSSELRAGFDWALQFRWYALSQDEQRYRGGGWNKTRAYASPVIAGGIFAMSRQWFLELGGFSKLLHTWGGESIEFSLKVWMCGGHVEIVPCSHVGHVFRSKLPYDLPLGENETRIMNAKFISEFWLSNYRPFFYENMPSSAGAPMFRRSSEVGIIGKQQCHTFRWYLENVFPELKVSSHLYAALGHLRQGDRCVELPAKSKHSEPSLSLCDTNSSSWMFKRNGHIVLESDPSQCLTAVGNVVTKMVACDSTLANQWHREQNTIVHRASGRCLDVLYRAAQRLVLNECNVRTRRTQIWHFTVDHIPDATSI